MPAPTSANLPLQGRSLLAARLLWTAVATLTATVFVISLPVYFTHLQTLCTSSSQCLPGQTTASAARSLRLLGLAPSVYAGYQVGLQVIVTAVSWGVAAVLFWKKSDDWVALLAGMFLITEFPSTQNGPLYALAASSPAWEWPVNLVLFLGLVSLCFFFFVFPDGRFVPRWTLWLALAAIALSVPQSVFPGSAGSWPDELSTIGFLALIAGIVLAQIYRYARVSTPLQRQQTKWVVLAVVVVILVGVVPPLVAPSLGETGTLGDLIETSAFSLVIVLVPLAIGVSILRYRLWDIDGIINKALVYSLLSALLLALYAGLIIGLESLAGAVMGGRTGSHPIVLVASTLIIAALFQPARRRLQSLIDRRFYRRKYDAEKTLRSFSTTLQGELDLEHLRSQLVTIIAETMQPALLSLWIRRPEADSAKQERHSSP